MTRILSSLGLLLLAAVAAAVMAACERSGAARSVVPVIVPRTPGESTRAAPAPASSDSTMTPALPQPRITIDPRDTVLQVITASLKPSPGEEQVIAIKRLSEVDSPARLVAVDLDPERGMYYFQSWESPTNATDNRVFSLAVKDLIGDHDVQLVASGMSKDGKLTLDVFRRVPAARGNELVYKPVCQIVADDIRVQDVDRPDSYASDTKDGASATIDAYLHDPDSQDVTDLVKISYQWKASENRFVPGVPEKVQAGLAGQENLTKLLANSGSDTFEDFLTGSWLVAPDDPSRAGKDGRYPTIISFDPHGRKIALSYGDTQEIYQWRDSLRTIYNRIYLIGDNDTVPQITRTFAVTALTPTSVSVSIQGNDTGDQPTVGYTKISEDLQSKLLSRAGAPQPAPAVAPAGVYHGPNGLSVDFHNPQLTWKSGGVQKMAVYVIFALRGRNILSARFTGRAGTAEEDRSWLIDFREKKDPASIVRTLLLSPVQLTVKGYQDTAGDAVSLEQSQDLRPK
ncbi:MAG TPA: pallilysin-related adhesin [Spirochaetia bacterium]|nr:pallilysin-related adhesin [Spirochaetia bacterium]